MLLISTRHFPETRGYTVANSRGLVNRQPEDGQAFAWFNDDPSVRWTGIDGTLETRRHHWWSDRIAGRFTIRFVYGADTMTATGSFDTIEGG